MLSKKWLGAAAIIATCTGACSSGGPVPQDLTGTKSAQQVAGMGCTPLMTTGNFLNCGALDGTSMALATQMQTTLSAQFGTMFANMTLMPDWTANQVMLTSSSADFGTFFGQGMMAPLTAGGIFTAAIPFQVGTIAPGFGLVANVWGAVPVWTSPGFAGAFPAVGAVGVAPIAAPVIAGPALAAPFAAGVGMAGIPAMGFDGTGFNTAAFNGSAVNTATLGAATMPLNIWISTPIGSTLPLACNGSIPLTCL